MILTELVPDDPPVKLPETVGIPQLYVVPVGTVPFITLTGFIVKVASLQIEVDIADIAGLGLRATTNVNGKPIQPFDEGVTE